MRLIYNLIKAHTYGEIFCFTLIKFMNIYAEHTNGMTMNINSAVSIIVRYQFLIAFIECIKIRPLYRKRIV